MNRIFDSQLSGRECIASEKVIEGEKIGYMYRQRPVEPEDSGWRFFTGNESAEYLENHIARVDIARICESNSRIISFLDVIWPSEFNYIDGEYVKQSMRKNYKRLISRITARIGAIDHMEKRENCFPVAILKSRGIMISLSGAQAIDERMISFCSDPDEYHFKLLDEATKSGAGEGDIVICRGEGNQAGGILMPSSYGPWITEIRIIDEMMLNKAQQNSVVSLMSRLLGRS